MKTRHSKSICLTTLAAAALLTGSARADVTALNGGLLGSAGNGVHLTGVTYTTDDPLLAPGGVAAVYDAGLATGSRTEIPFLSQLNPAATSPFTIEVWLDPTVSSNDSCALFNRRSASPRSGWALFQRPVGNAAGGWNFVMYDGSGSSRGWDLTGGLSTLNTWHYLTMVWDGTTAKLFYDGVDTNAANNPNGPVTYNPNAGPDPSDRLSLGRYGDGSDQTRFTGGMDEFAFYPTALTPSQIATHYDIATTSLIEGAYHSAVINDGAIEYLQNTELVPEPASLALLGVAGCALGARRRRR